MSENAEHVAPVYTLREPAPHDCDIPRFQRMLDAEGGFIGSLPNLRVGWAPDCMVNVDGQPRAQYVYPAVSEFDCKEFVDVLENGDRFAQRLPFDEDSWEPQYERFKGRVFAVRTIHVERAICVWIIQALVPPRITNKGRNDDILDVSRGAYELAHWCTTDGTEFGKRRPVVDSDIDEVKAMWRERNQFLKHRHDEESAPDFWRLMARRRFQRMKARQRAALAVGQEERQDRARFRRGQLAGGEVEVLKDEFGRPARLKGRGANKLISIPRIVLPKEITS